MHVLTVAWDQLVKISDAFLNSAKWKLLEFQGSRVGIYYVSFFLIFLRINNAIPYLLAVQKNSFLGWNLFAQTTWKLSILNSSCLQNSTYENKSHLDAHLKSNISRWLLSLSLSITLQNIEFRSDFGFGTFFWYTCIFAR